MLSSSMSPLELLDKLVKGEVKLYKLTVPEGYNIYQIAELAAAAGFVEIPKLCGPGSFSKSLTCSGQGILQQLQWPGLSHCG